MKKLIYTLPLMALGLLASCSNDDVTTPEPQPVPSEEGFFIEFKANIPSVAGTKSLSEGNDESSDRTQEASGNESKISSAIAYFFTESEGSYTSILTTTLDDVTGTTTLTLKGEVEKDDLKDLAGKTLKIFIVANPGTINHTSLTTPGTAKFTASDAGIQNIKSFVSGTTYGQEMPLVNYKEVTLNLSNVSNILNACELASGVYTLKASEEQTSFTGVGEIELERALARVDYGDIRTSNHTDNVFKLDGSTDNYYLKLTKLEIANVNSESYLFRHTIKGTKESAFGVSTETAQLFGNEKSEGNNYWWIVGSDWTTNGKSFSAASNTNKSIDWTDLKNENRKITSGSETYYSWGYITENTLPTVALMDGNDLESNATYVDFTFQLCTDEAGDNAKKGTPSSELTILMDDASSQTFTADNNGNYYLTYRGIIEHNEGKNGETASKPMRYAIVRNNVYQLSINSITHLPEATEMSKMYLQLQVKVKEWVKRKNGFDF